MHAHSYQLSDSIEQFCAILYKHKDHTIIIIGNATLPRYCCITNINFINVSISSQINGYYFGAHSSKTPMNIAHFIHTLYRCFFAQIILLLTNLHGQFCRRYSDIFLMHVSRCDTASQTSIVWLLLPLQGCSKFYCGK